MQPIQPPVDAAQFGGHPLYFARDKMRWGWVQERVMFWCQKERYREALERIDAYAQSRGEPQ